MAALGNLNLTDTRTSSESNRTVLPMGLRAVLGAGIYAFLLLVLSACSGNSDPAVVQENPQLSPTGTLSIQPAQVSLTQGDTVPLTARLGSASLRSAQVTWSVVPADVASVDGNGRVIGHKHGEATVRARYLAQEASSRVEVRAEVRALEALSSSTVSGVVGRYLPDSVAVMVTADDGTAIAGVPVAFQIGSGEGILSHDFGPTGPDGIARTSWRLGTVAGTQEMLASVDGLGDVLFQADALADYDSVSIEVVAGDGQEGQVATFLPEALMARVTDQFGNPLPGLKMAWTFSGGGGAVVNGGAETSAAPLVSSAVDADGIIEVLWHLGTDVGPQEAILAPVEAGAEGTSGNLGGGGPTGAPKADRGKSFTAEASPGDPETLQLSPEESWVLVGETLILNATVLDAFGNQIEARNLKWEVDGSGIVSVDDQDVIHALKAGRAQVTVSSPSQKVAGTAWVNVQLRTPASMMAASGNGQKGTVGARLASPLTAQVLDETGNPVSGIEVLFQVLTGNGRLNGGASASVLTDEAGTARVDWTLGEAPGAQSVGAEVEGIAPIQFQAQAVPGPVAQVTLSPSQAQVEEGSSQAFTANARDAFGNPVTGDMTRFSSSDSTMASVSINGLARGLRAGTTQVLAEIDGVTGAAQITVTETPPVLSFVEVTPSASEVETGETLQLTATGLDADGQPMAGLSFTWSSSDPSVAAVSSDGLATAGAAGTAEVRAEADGITGAAQLTVTAPPPPPPPAENPGTVQDLSVASTTETSVTLRWTQVDDGTGAPASYALRMGTPTISWGDAYPTEAGLSGTGIGNTMEYTRSGLDAGTQYQFKMVSYRGTLNVDAVFGPMSNTVTGTTDGGAQPDTVVAQVVANPSQVQFIALDDQAQVQATALNSLGQEISGAIMTLSTSNPSVATVDQIGNVTAKAVGTALITASAVCCGKADTVAVEVIQSPRKVEAFADSVAVDLGETQAYSATVLDKNGHVIPDAEVVWMSTSPAVADFVAPGQLQTKGPGATQLRAQAGAYMDTGLLVVADTVSTPDSPPPPTSEGVLFSDSFESADFSATGEGFSWKGPNRTSIVRDDGYVVNNGSPVMVGPLPEREWENAPGSAGHHALRFRYPAGDNMAEQRFMLPGERQEVWVSFWWRVPLNFYHNGGNNNQKLLALWMDSYEYSGAGPTVVWQFRGNENGGSGITVYHVATDEGQSQRHSGERPGGSLITVPGDRGRWMHLVFHVVASTDAANPNGVIQTWRRWENESSYTQMHDIQNAQTHIPSGSNGFRMGYVMGWANAPYSQNTEFLLDDFTVSTTSPIR